MARFNLTGDWVSGTRQADGSWVLDVAGGGGGGGGGGAVTVADGSDVAQGARADAAYSDTTGAGAGSVVALLKGLYVSLRTQIQSVRLAALTASTNRSGTATTTSGGLSVAANASRVGLVGQNISAVVIGFNEFGGTAAIGTAATYTVAAGSSFSISTSNAVNFVAASGTAAVTLTEY